MNTGFEQFARMQDSNSRKTVPLVQIGNWKVDPNLDEISSRERTVKLEPRTMRLLLYLAANRNRVVGLPEMLDEIWPNVVVTSQSVYSTIAQLRQILGDSAESPTYIATVPRKGYRLIAEVQEVAAISDPVSIPEPVLLRESAVVAAGPVDAVVAVRDAGRLWILLAAFVAVVGLAAFFYMRLRAPAARAASSVPTSVAVLPFLDLSEKKDFEYFSDGLTEELIDLLAHNTSLRVPARTSSFFFKGKAAPVAAIAQQLNVANLLEGSVRRSGDTVRVTAQLIRASDGYHLWSETYDRHNSDELAVEDDIASKVAETLRAKLTPRATLGVQGALDNAARNLLLECEFYVARNTPSDTVKSVACFQKLAAAIPTSARAWAGYANALLRRPGLVEESDAQRRDDRLAAVGAVHLALQLDPNAADAHAAYANYLMNVELNWDAAKKELDAALKSDPNEPVALLSAARLAEYLGRMDEVISLCGLARERDPLNFLAYARLWVAYMRLGRYQDAEAAARRRLDISPDGSGGHTDLAMALVMQGRADEALAENARESGPRARLIGDGVINQAMGRHPAADAVFNEMVQKYSDTDPMYVAELSAYRGDVDRAFELLGKGVSAAMTQVYMIKIDFLFNSLRADPRYPLLLQRMHLAD